MSRKIIIHLISCLFLALVSFAFIHFLDFHEKRASHLGWIPNDPLGEMLPAADMSYPIFSITYGSLILYAFLSLNTEFFVPRLMLAYAFILLFRFVTLSLIPFKAPTSYVFLQDPFLNELIYPGHIRNDLFFSGHTALVFAIFVLSEKKWVFFVLTLLTGILVMIQRVHYSYDVLAAFPFAWLSAKLAVRIISGVNKDDNA